MLLKIKQLIIENKGYKRSIKHKNIYVNSNSIVSISDYEGASYFLLSEGSEYHSDSFSLVKVSQGNRTDDIIAFGTAEKLYAEIKETSLGKTIING